MHLSSRARDLESVLLATRPWSADARVGHAHYLVFSKGAVVISQSAFDFVC